MIRASRQRPGCRTDTRRARASVSPLQVDDALRGGPARVARANGARTPQGTGSPAPNGAALPGARNGDKRDAVPWVEQRSDVVSRPQAARVARPGSGVQPRPEFLDLRAAGGTTAGGLAAAYSAASSKAPSSRS